MTKVSREIETLFVSISLEWVRNEVQMKVMNFNLLVEFSVIGAVMLMS